MQNATISSNVSGSTLLGGLHHRAHALAALGVGEPDDGDVLDLRMRVEESSISFALMFSPLRMIDVLEPAGEHDVAVGAQLAEVAGAEVAVGVEGLAQ